MRFSQAAWQLLVRAYEPAMRQPSPHDRACMLLGAHLAGAAIEQSMLGAAHACANPLTARFGIVHGVAVGVMLPAVVKYNASAGDNPYASLEPDATVLVAKIQALLTAGGLPSRVSDCNVPKAALTELAFYGAEQWTAKFNPRPVDAPELLEIFRLAY
jgi:alcohol dehydrogenase